MVAVALLLPSSLTLGCGTQATRNGSSASASTAAQQEAPVRPAPNVKLPVTALPQDEDDDDGPGEERGHNSKDSDVDGDNDLLKPRGYFDRDDAPARTYGHAANGAVRRDLTALAKRYYASAAAADGTAACSMFVTAFAKTVPQDYGRGSVGPSYLRSAQTCPAVMTLLFKHAHAHLDGSIEVIEVRVDNNQGLVLIGARDMPASYLEVQRQGGDWAIVGLFASPLP